MVDIDKLENGDTVIFNGYILTLDYFDAWFGIWMFKELHISPIEYQTFDKPIKIANYV